MLQIWKPVGQAILPAAAFQAALSDQARIFALAGHRLKAGGSQDWLPHMMPDIAERLAAIRAQVDRACVMLTSPDPASLEESSRFLQAASLELAAIASPIPATDKILAASQSLRSSVRRAAALLQHAAAFHQGWRRILGSMCSGYQPGGSASAIERQARVSIEG